MIAIVCSTFYNTLIYPGYGSRALDCNCCATLLKAVGNSPLKKSLSKEDSSVNTTVLEDWDLWAELEFLLLGRGGCKLAFLNRNPHSMTDLSYSLLSAGCYAKLSTLGTSYTKYRKLHTPTGWVTSYQSGIELHQSEPVQLRCGPITVEEGLNGPRELLDPSAVSYVCNVRPWAAATNYRERVTPSTSRANNLTLVLADV